MQVDWNQNREFADAANAANACLLSSSQCVYTCEPSQRVSARGGGELCEVHGVLLEKGPELVERYLFRVTGDANTAQ